MERRGRYEITGAFASGATSTVHLARVIGTERVVAVKRLHPHLATDELRARLAREAKIVARIAHPNVVQVVEAIESEGETLLVMEYVEGETLERLLADGQRVSPEIAVAITRDVLHGLHAAHHARDEGGAPLALVHRDVSPKNVIVGLDGRAKLLDFGIAKATGHARTTRDGHVRGTLAYMAPEQLAGEPLGPAADIYGLAVVLWEALTGALLVDGESDEAITRRILDHAFAAPSTIAPGIPRALDAAVMRGLARSPDARFATALEMALAVEDAVRPAPAEDVARWVEVHAGRAVAARRRRAEAAAPRGDARDDGDDDDLAAVSPPRRRSWPVAVAVLVAVIGATAAAIATSKDEGAHARTPPATTDASVAALATVVQTTPRDDASAFEPMSAVVAEAPPRDVAATNEPPRARPIVRAAPSGAPAASEAPSAAPLPAPTESCSPYWVDSAGRRRFNRECLR
jgi:serine/threonine-protein kinase